MESGPLDLDETRHQWAAKHTRGAVQGYWYGLLALNFVLTLTSAVASAVLPVQEDLGGRIRVGLLTGLAAFIIGALLLLLLTYMVCWCIAPSRQRDEARGRVRKLEAELHVPTLFDVVCPTISLGLPINRLKDGTWQASSAAIGIGAIQIVHRGDLTNVTRVTAIPEIRFTRADNKGWTSNFGWVTLKPVPMFNPPDTLDFQWDVTNPNQWVLNGLPLTMGKEELLQLQPMMLTVVDANAVGARFAELDTCKLMIAIVMRTDKGSTSLPVQTIDLTMSSYPGPGDAALFGERANFRSCGN
jgi:hypothetical protein